MQNYFTPYQYQQPIYNQMPQYPMNAQPTMQPQPQVQQPMQQLPSYILGKTVNSAADIMAVDVPMGAQKVFFPQADGKIMYARSWGSDGLIKPETYVLQEQETNQPSEQSDELSKIYEKLAVIEEKLSKWEA